MSEEEDNCPICFEKIDKKERYFLPCSHYFHQDCVEKWLRKNTKCPICKTDVYQDDVYQDDEPDLEPLFSRPIIRIVFMI